MSGLDVAADAVRSAWSAVAAPPESDLRLLAWAYGEDTWRAFAGVAPMDVDTTSPAFGMCTPLLELSPRAAAAYLGTYLISLLDGLRAQQKHGIFPDILTRAHTLTCLTSALFWRKVADELPAPCRLAMRRVVDELIDHQDLLALEPAQVDELHTNARSIDVG